MDTAPIPAPRQPADDIVCDLAPDHPGPCRQLPGKSLPADAEPRNTPLDGGHQ